MREEISAQLSTPDLISWKEFSKLTFAEERWLIQGLLPLEGLVILASPSGEKKTWVALSMAYSIAAGRDFLEHPEFKTEKSRVLYLDQEMSRRELNRRGKLLGFSEETEDLIIPADLTQVDLSDDEWQEWLNQEIIKYDIRVVFIDTLRAVAGGLKEDRAEDVREFFNKFISYKKMGLCVIFLDHCRKPHPFEGRVPKKEQLLGSQDKVASIESLIMLKSEERNPEIKVYPKKSRTGIEFKPFSICLESTLNSKGEEIGVALKYSGGIDEKEYKSEEAKEFILAFLSDQSKSTRQVLDYLAKDKKIGGSNARQALRDLSDAGKVRVSKQGRENIYAIENVAESSLWDSS